MDRHRLYNTGKLPRPYHVNRRWTNKFNRSLESISRAIDRAGSHIPVPTLQEIVNRYTGNKRLMYQKALDSYMLEGLGEIYHVGMAKWGELVDPEKVRTRAVIMQCSHSSKGRLMLPILIENRARIHQGMALEKLHKSKAFPLVDSLVFACGHSLAKRARVIRRMFSDGWVCISLDATSFDGSIAELADMEREKLSRNPRYRDKDLTRVLNDQKVMNVKYSGLKARILGNRASGTAGTSVGNKLVFAAACMSVFEGQFNQGRLKLYSDGDDTLVFMPVEDLKGLDNKLRSFQKLGLEVKKENVAYSVEQVVFCRASPMYTAEGITLVKNPVDAVRTCLHLRRHFRGHELRNYLSSLHTGFKHLWAGVPVLSEVHRMYPNKGIANRELLASSGIEYLLGALQAREVGVSAAARSSFESTFGISLTSQFELENLFRTMENHNEILLSEPGESVCYHANAIPRLL